MTSTVGEEAERPAIATASIGAPLVESPMVHRSPALATEFSSRHANKQGRRGRRATRPESSTCAHGAWSRDRDDSFDAARRNVLVTGRRPGFG